MYATSPGRFRATGLCAEPIPGCFYQGAVDKTTLWLGDTHGPTCSFPNPCVKSHASWGKITADGSASL